MEKVIENQKGKKKKLLSLLLKLILTAGCIWYVTKKLDFEQVGESLMNANWLLLFAGIICYVLSKVVASIRLNIYFKNIGLALKQVDNLKLYWLGLFYNLFLPGSITGDAYKVIRLTEVFKVSYKKTISAVLLDRVTGLLGLLFVLAFYSLLVLDNFTYIALIAVGATGTTIGSYFIIKKWFNDFSSAFWATFIWGLVVQLFANSTAYAIIFSLGISNDLNRYMLVFLLASIAAVLPLTLGGLGAREIVFFEMSDYFHLNAHTSVLIGFLVYLTVLISSFGGIIFIFRDPLKNVKANE